MCIFDGGSMILLIATGQLACYVDNELGGFDGHHLAAKYRQNNCMPCMSKSPELVIRQKQKSVIPYQCTQLCLLF